MILGIFHCIFSIININTFFSISMNFAKLGNIFSFHKLFGFRVKHIELITTDC